MSKLLWELVLALIAAMAALLSPENVRKVIDKAFDYVENKITASSATWDDRALLPVLHALRVALNVPDNDEPVMPEPAEGPTE